MIEKKRIGEDTQLLFGSGIIRKEDCDEAIRRVIPSIEMLMQEGILHRPDLSIVVLDPAVPFFWGEREKGMIGPEEVILSEKNWGNRSKWEHPYDEYAFGKSMVTWRTGLPSWYVIQQAPHLLRMHEFKFGGSAILNGIVSGVSGAKQQYDQMIAEWIVSSVRAIGIERMIKKLGESGARI